MTRAAAAAAALLAALAPSVAAAQSPRDVPHFLRNPAERRAMQRWCAADAARQDTAECRNAKAAGASELVTPGHPWSRGRLAFPALRPAAPPARPPPPRLGTKGPVRGT